MKDKVKVAYIINSLVVGGRENVVIDLCNYIDHELFEVHLITFAGGDEVQFKKLRSSVYVHDLGYRNESLVGWRIVFKWMGVLQRLTALLRKIYPSIVHSHVMFHWLLLVALATKRSGPEIRHVQTLHTSGLYYSNGGLINRIRIKTEKIAAGISHPTIVAVSDDVFQRLTALFGPSKAVLKKIYNGLDIGKFRNSALDRSDDSLVSQINGRTAVVYVARLDIGKNHLLLLQAWKDVVSTHPDCVLVLVGEGSQRNILEEYILANALTEHVILLGNRNDVAFILSCMQIAVFPSAFEGFGVSLVEKMAMKLPVVVSDIGVFTGIVDHRKNGIVVQLNNVEELKAGILELLEKEELRKVIGDNGYNAIQKFSIENMIKGYEKIYLNEAD